MAILIMQYLQYDHYGRIPSISLCDYGLLR